MTTAFYKFILKTNSYKEQIKDFINYDDFINHLISKGVIEEKDYLKIHKCKNDKIDEIFKTVLKKPIVDLNETFRVLKSLYGDEFEVKLEKIKGDIVDNIHHIGGFPKINTYIRRIEQEKKIKDKLPTIKWDNSLVIYGRVGEGKSYLVCECLKDLNVVIENFNNRLHWINVGECENGSNILQPLTRLLRMIATKKRKLYDLDELIQELSDIFATEKHKNSLVILDNARSLKVIETFQRIRCKLIVITHFKSVKNSEFVEINLGFTLNETIRLFAQYLKTTTENLNNLYLDEIKDIHELCKGHPTTLSLLGVFLSCKRDHALASKYLWNYIKNKIDKGEIEDLGKYNVDIIPMNFYNALRMCIDTIESEEMKELYYQLAVFPKDANISTEVLQVFWNKTPEDVWNIMLHFENRSLINSFYNINRKVYIYVIHDLFLYYLKSKTKKKTKEFHRKLIESYEKRYEYHNLPDDNYILLFLGYHLKQAEMSDRFQKFLDLKFIDHKIKIVGVNNMEQDLKMYKEEIIEDNEELQRKWEKCKNLIRENKNELQLEKTDIIQLALPTLMNDAQTLMDRNKENSIDKLYLTIKYSAGRLKSSYELNVEEKVTSMVYCYDSNQPKILIGFQTGDIQLYCPQTGKQFDKFQSHTRTVYDLKVSKDNLSFISTSKDRTIKLWQFFNQRLSLDGLKDIATSPKCIQTEHFDAFSPGKKHNFKEFVYNEDGDYLISANFSNNYSESRIICTGTNNGKVIIWSVSTREKLCVTTETGFPAECVFFSNDDAKIYFTKQENIQIYEYAFKKLNYLESVTNKEDIRKLYVTDEDVLIAIGPRSVVIHKAPYEEESLVYTSEDDIACSAIAKDEYFAIGVKKQVFLFSISNEKVVDTLKHTKSVVSMTMDSISDDDNITSMISMQFDNNTIQQCNIMMHLYGQPRNEQNLVTTYWRNNSPRLAQVLNDKVLKIQQEFNTITQIEIPHRICFITFSLCGNHIIYALENGVVTEYQYKRRDCYKTLATFDSTVKYLQAIDLERFVGDNEISYNSSESCNGAILVVTDGGTKIHILIDGGVTKNYSWDFDIFQVFPMGNKKLLCIDVGGSVVVIHTDESSINLVNYATFGRTVTSSTFCKNNNQVAIIFTENTQNTNYLEIIDITTTNTIRTKHLSGFTPTCCAFSFSGDLLAVGSNDGRLIVINLEKKLEFTMTVSNFSIQFMQFAKSNLPILVVVGREISWWNLKNSATGSTEIDSIQNQFDFDFWKSKTVHEEVPSLLQTISLYSNAVHFSVSENFETFLVVDDENRINVIQCFKCGERL